MASTWAHQAFWTSLQRVPAQGPANQFDPGAFEQAKRHEPLGQRPFTVDTGNNGLLAFFYLIQSHGYS